jgi:hypothetical protein
VHFRIAFEVRTADTHGKTPLSAKVPGVPPALDQSRYIWARSRALSRLPAARRCGSAISNAPSVKQSVTGYDRAIIEFTFIEKLANIMMKIRITCGTGCMFGGPSAPEFNTLLLQKDY